jgi:5'-3' exonuclease
MKALIDMDLVLYRCAASAEDAPVGIAIYRVTDLLDTLLEKTQADSYRAFISSKTNYRKVIDPMYKANRTAPKPLHLKALTEYALTELFSEVAPDGLEADDAMGIYQDKEGLETTIVTLDKDLLMIPGKHYQWAFGTSKWKKDEKYIEQTPLGGLRLFYEQCLKGDKVDNIMGIPGIGKVKAARALEYCVNEKEMFDIVRQQYSDDEEFKKNAQCLWILQSIDDSFLNRFKELDTDDRPEIQE